jgi:hypothetical protein
MCALLLEGTLARGLLVVAVDHQHEFVRPQRRLITQYGWLIGPQRPRLSYCTKVLVGRRPRPRPRDVVRWEGSELTLMSQIPEMSDIIITVLSPRPTPTWGAHQSIRNVKTGANRVVDTGALFIMAGVAPNTEWLSGLVKL